MICQEGGDNYGTPVFSNIVYLRLLRKVLISIRLYGSKEAHFKFTFSIIENILSLCLAFVVHGSAML